MKVSVCLSRVEGLLGLIITLPKVRSASTQIQIAYITDETNTRIPQTKIEAILLAYGAHHPKESKSDDVFNKIYMDESRKQEAIYHRYQILGKRSE